MKDRVDPSSRQHNHQEMDSQTLESMLVCTKPQQEKKPKPQAEHALKCPRCDSSNTKFCYYNNYSLTQPRYFCKSCRRYWTQGGTLRNVPVGGGCRKNKRSSSSSSLSSNSSKIRTHIENQLDHHHNQPLCHLPPLTYDHSSHDLALALAKFQKQSSNGQMGFDDQDQISDTHMGIHLGNQMDQSSPMSFNHLYNHYGEMGYHVGNAELGGAAGTIMGLNMGDHQEMTIPFEELRGGAVSNGRGLGDIVQHENHNRSVLWGFPWQFGDGSNSMGLDHIDARGSWNGIGSTWHGLLNSPLM